MPVPPAQWPALVRQARLAPQAALDNSTHVAVSDYEPCERCGVLRYRRRDQRTRVVDTCELSDVALIEICPGGWGVRLTAHQHVCRKVTPAEVAAMVRAIEFR
jgi:hypothetical protein